MLPIIARNMFRIQERLLGRRSFAILSQLRQSERWDRQRLKELQLERLRNIVKAAYENTIYWREVMKENGFTSDDIQSLADLQRFPLLDKATMRRRAEDMVWRNEGKRLQFVSTSGFTSEALRFYTSSTREGHINAARMRGHEWIGIRRGDKEMYFWGSPIELSKQDWIKKIRDWLINDGLTNGFEVTPELVARYFTQWKKWRPKCIFGYAGTVVLTVLIAGAHGIDLRELHEHHGLKAICTTSEMLTDMDRRLISETFGVGVYDSYGLREAGLIGHECEHGTMHCMDEQVLLETIDPKTHESVDGQGELVVTNIVGPAMPVFRYRTGDIVELYHTGCLCGRTLSHIKISGGRITDSIITDKGKWVLGYSFMYISRSVKGIVKIQVHQERIGEIRVLLVTDQNFPSDGIEQIQQAVRARLGSTDNIVVELVDDIAPTPSGKYRLVVSKVTEEMLAKGEMALDR